MVAGASPTVLKRWIAFELRRLRDEAGRSRQEAADRVGKAASQIGHLETMRNLPSASDLEVLLTWYGHPERVEFFRDLLKQAKKGRDWWVGIVQDAPEWFFLFVGLESAATQIESFNAQVVPGLFQTEPYAEAIFRGGAPEIPDREVKERIALRMARQQIVEREQEPPQVWAVLDESVLRRTVGGPEVMRDQLDRLLELSEKPNVDIQVLPLAAGAHTGMDGTFTILSFPSEVLTDPGVVYTESRIKGVYYEDPDEIRVYRNVLDRLRVKALDQDASREVIAQAMKEL